MIQVENLTFRYPGNCEPTIKGIEFSVDEGEIFGFLGPNGAGKTTIQKILLGILKKYEGNVRVMSKELDAVGSDFYESVGVAFEFPNLFSKFTALENLNFFKSLYSGETDDPINLLSLVGLEQDANTRVSEFSKGMKMRLNFCRSLLNQPNLLFLDEPTSGLDPVNLRKIREIIKAQKAAGKTICLTTHDMHIADSLCDRVAFIVDGQIALIDSPRSLKMRNGSRVVRIEYRDNNSLNHAEFELDGISENPQFLEILRTKHVETIHTQEATLEDIFIKTTGRRLL
ncbi:ABC transporter ATP-binding protein [candidate division KSB1 bacterium]|nr:ABC transporter ATP-binding protein [candidate division KSB1 bacterium]NIR68898.1 ABC transporter ATP-binding protein [candidate division KSB1 bacterium]NIS24023.1 ABC transporter ATP-binding protein [candidate division KSB1 bacterium]NIT73187.1 ABC transporter ATP-binding protein [candidate division KSB1 bacterium]NIU24673.1 ABC transporter ATP-binding protein [candidate division KSB1 bacterium]